MLGFRASPAGFNLHAARPWTCSQLSSAHSSSVSFQRHAVREDSIVQRAHDSQSSAVVKHLHSCPGCVTQPGLIPVLDPKLDDLPFAMSLEICKGTTQPAVVSSKASPICELFYFLQGSGTVSVSTPNYPPWEKEVRAGDSLFTPLNSTTVNKPVPEREDSQQDLVYLRLLLPMQYVLDDIEDPELVQECRQAVQEATKHWDSERCQSLSAETVHSIVNNAHQFKQMLQPQTSSHNHQLSLDAMYAESGGDTQGKDHSDPAPPSIVQMNVLDAPHYQLPNQENRLALVLDPTQGNSHEVIPFTFGVEMFPPGHVTMPHVHNQAHELFFVLAGSGTACCNESVFPIAAGDCVVFPPGTVHGVNASEKLYCIELMLPNEEFAEFVRRGLEATYDADDSCVLAAIGC